MQYPDGMAVEPFDQVEVITRKGKTGDGFVRAIHPLKQEVTVRYDTGEIYRSSGAPVYKTDRFPIADVELIARDG